MNQSGKPPVVAIVGPTASGKTGLSINLAEQFDGEIISADSRQIYRGLDIGTGKITHEEMQSIPHHLLDIIDLGQTYNVAQFVRDATAHISAIHMSGRIPFVVGGTNFYVDTLRGLMQPAPVPANPTLRAELDQRTTPELFAQLQKLDPDYAGRIDPHNRRRVMRAVEIVSELGHMPPTTRVPTNYRWLVLALRVDKETLRSNFAKRLRGWLATGLMDEVRLVRSQLTDGQFQELGFEYTLAAQYADCDIELEEFEQRFIEKNWQYAKRQYTWLKRDTEVTWIDPDDVTGAQHITAEFLENIC
jgi:tRNA dimethylallyltransferase